MKVELDGRMAHAATGGVDITEASRADDPVMLLIHGAGMDGTVWQLQTRYLAHHGFRPVAVDLPGHGGSEGDPLTSIADMAGWTARFLEAADLASAENPAHVVGHSMGSFIGLGLAADRPDLVLSLTLLGTADGMPVHPDLLSASEDQLDRAAALMASWSHARPAHIGLNPTPGLWMLGGARALVEASEPGALAADFRACAAHDTALANAAQVSCPVTVVVGAGDRMTPPKAAAKLIEALGGEGRDDHADGGRVKTVTLPDVGHMMMIEEPRAVRQVLAGVS